MPKSDTRVTPITSSSTDLNRSSSHVEAKAGAPTTAVMPLTGDDADDTAYENNRMEADGRLSPGVVRQISGYDPDDVHLGHGHALSKKFRANYVAEDGRMHQKDVEHIIQALDKEEKVISHQKWGMVTLALVIIAVAVALGGALDASARSAVEEAKTDPTVFISESAAADEATLTSPGGAQVQVVQSGAQMMLGMLSFFIQADPLQAIKSLPESMVLWDPRTQGWAALRPTMMFLREADFRVTIECASGHQIVIHDEMHGTVFQTAAALSDWNALDAAGNPPDSRTDNATASRYHFCAACVPIELKSILTNGNLDRAFAQFDNVTQNRSCEAVTGARGFDAFASNVVAVCAECALQRMTYTPQVCLPDPAARARREEGGQDGEWASHRRDYIKRARGRRRGAAWKTRC